MFPSIGYVDKKSTKFFDKKYRKEIESNEVHQQLVKFFGKQTLIVIINGWDYQEAQPIIDKINSKKPKKIIFFIYDIFRIHTPYQEKNIDKTFLIEEDPNNVKSCELDIISSIIQKTELPFEVYHCESNCSVFEKNYNFKINYFDLFLADWTYKHKLSQRDNKSKKNSKKWKYRFSCFSARFELHKYILTTYLLSLDNNLCSQLQKITNENLEKKLFSDNFHIDNFRKDIIYKTNRQNDTKQHTYDTTFRPYYIDTDFNFKNVPSSQQNRNITGVSESFIHIIAESRFISPMANISEKTLKPIIAKRPFILASTPYSLQLVKSMGFKTFSEFWDESYDEVTDHSKRLGLILDLIDYLNSLSNKNLKRMHKHMHKILEFNYSKINSMSITRSKGNLVLR